jgi:hypothetical protein
VITRSIDNENDWNFGNGRESYQSEQLGISQSIKTRVQSFYQDCYFDLPAGIDWFSFLGTKNVAGLKNAVAKAILNTTGVFSLNELNFIQGENRDLLIQYSVTTIWSETLTETVSMG